VVFHSSFTSRERQVVAAPTKRMVPSATAQA
jgi:hypothetical protein